MASIVSLHGMNMDPFEQSWSVIVSIESYSSDGGNLVMKSSAVIDLTNEDSSSDDEEL